MYPNEDKNEAQNMQRKNSKQNTRSVLHEQILFASVNISSLDIYESILIIDCTKCIPETYLNEHFYNF